jgi:predicted component of type VI protein secretion system
MIKRFHRFTYCFILGLIIAGCNTTNKKSVKVDHKPTMLNSEKENVKLNTLEDSLEIFTITKASRIDYINAKKYIQTN